MAFPECRNPALRLLYIDDASCVETVNLKETTVDLLPTLGLHGRMGGSGLGIPVCYLALEHRLADIKNHAEVMGMVLNEQKTKLIVFNPTKVWQAIPFISLNPGNPLLCVDEIKILGLEFDQKLTWWPMLRKIVICDSK